MATFYVSAQTGNDSNNGTSPNAKIGHKKLERAK